MELSNCSALNFLREIIGDEAESCEVLSTVTQPNAHGTKMLTKNGDRIFVKTVLAPNYGHKAWTDLRRTLLYGRTEVRFYKEFLPKLESMGMKGFAPYCYGASYNLDGLIAESERAEKMSNDVPKGTLEDRGAFLALQTVNPDHYFQDSPLTPDQASKCLAAVAKLHAAAWEDPLLLSDATDRLSRGSWNLQLRSPKEIDRLVLAWEHFRSEFNQFAPALFARESVKNLGHRVFAVAEAVSKELSPCPHDRYATLIHGDYKAMNVFIPRNSSDEAIMIDFASVGVGIGMSDVAMHIYHALRPSDINEEELIDAYLLALFNAKKSCNKDVKPYLRDVAVKHFKLAVIDYFRFFLGRFWNSATLEGMKQKKTSRNINLINRDPDAAIAFVEKVDRFLTEYECSYLF
jgi:Ecdysteroid kinase-like family